MNKPKTMRQKFEDWYRGPFVPGPSNELVFFVGEHRPTLAARALRTVVEFWLKHWKWIITTIIAITLAVRYKA